MIVDWKKIIGIVVLTALYPLTGYVTVYLPNPMVPGAIIALNMIFPVLAGYFYGIIGGAVAGGIGTAIAGLLQVSMWDMLAILPHTLMGCAASGVKRTGSAVLTSLCILIGHGLNMLIYIRMELLAVTPEKLPGTLLGLASETAIDIVAIVLLIHIGKRLLRETA